MEKKTFLFVRSLVLILPILTFRQDLFLDTDLTAFKSEFSTPVGGLQ